MGFGAEGIASVMGLVYLYVGLFVLMVAASTIFTFVARRVLVWTQIVFILMVPLWFDEKRTLFVILLAAWFMVAWPRSRSSGRAATGKKPWHPLLAIFAPPASVGVVVLVTVLLLSLLQGSPAPSDRNRVPSARQVQEPSKLWASGVWPSQTDNYRGSTFRGSR